MFSNVPEEWRPIVGYEGLYSVSSLGRIRGESRNNGRFRDTLILSQVRDYEGYLRVSLSKNGKGKGFKVHRIVATAFLPTIPQCIEVNHINGDKTDNRCENLEWVTHKENMRHAAKVLKVCSGATGKLIGASNPAAKLSEEDVLNIRALLKDGSTCVELAAKYDVSVSLISAIKNRTKWTHL